MRDDDAVRRPPTHFVGDKLDDLSVADLAARILVLREEIERLEAEVARKRTAAAAALSVFKS